jgi:hypothetical protein
VLGGLVFLAFACSGDDSKGGGGDDSVPVDDSSADDSGVDDSGGGDDSGTPKGFSAVLTPFPTMVNEMYADITLPDAHAIAVVCEAPTSDPWPERIIIRSDEVKTEHNVLIDAMLADTTYSCTVEDGSDVLGTFDVTTDPLPPQIDFTGATVEFRDISTYVPGWTLYNPSQTSGSGGPGNGADLVVDAMGRVRWYIDWYGYDGDAAFEYDAAAKQFYGGGGFFQIEPITGWDMDGTELFSWPKVGGDHDVDKLDDDYFVLTSIGMDHCVDQWDGAKSHVWSWCAIDSPDLVDSFANSLAVRDTAKGKFVYATMQIKGIIYKLDYDTKEIVWQLKEGGDFTGDVEYPPWQHDLHVIDCPGYDECLLSYVNGVEADPTTYAREVGINETTMEATVVREWTEKGWEEVKIGGIDPFGDDGNRWLIAQGHFVADPFNDRPSQLVELAPNNTVDWRLTVATTDIQVYRARRVAACDAFHHAGYCPSLEK